MIEAAPDIEGFIEDTEHEIVAAVHDELNQWGLHISDVEDAEVDESTVERVTFLDFRAFRMVGERNLLVVGRIEMDVKISYHHPDWDTATYDSEDKVLLPHRTVEDEKEVSMEADFTMTLNVDQHGKPNTISKFSFDDEDFIWVSVLPSDFDYK